MMTYDHNYMILYDHMFFFHILMVTYCYNNLSSNYKGSFAVKVLLLFGRQNEVDI